MAKRMKRGIALLIELIIIAMLIWGFMAKGLNIWLFVLGVLIMGCTMIITIAYNKFNRLSYLAYIAVIVPIIYKKYSRKPVNENLTVFVTYQYKGLHSNIKELRDALVEEKPNMEFEYFLEFAYKLPYFKRMKHIYCMMRAVARAKFVVATHPVAPFSVIKMRPETTFIQLWHACGAFKKWGYALENKGGPMFRNTSYAVASSESIIPQYSLAFNLPENRVLPLGVPRTDRFFRADYCEVSRDVLEKEFPSARGKKVILFAPTFRGDKLHSAEYEIELDLDLMYTILDGEYVLVCKMHPAVPTPCIDDKYKNFVHVCDSETDINELMGAADILVTDYSSIIFEYSLINRPMLFFAPDYKEYATGRGFFYDYDEFIPGEMVMNTQQLVAAIKNQGYDMDRIQVFRQKFMSACDGQASKRIVKELFE